MDLSLSEIMSQLQRYRVNPSKCPYSYKCPCFFSENGAIFTCMGSSLANVAL